MIPKFRGFRTKTEEWVEGNLIYREEPYQHDIVTPIGNCSTISYAVERGSIGQWTGLKDKNGVEIYEGDIVHWLKEFISPMDMRTKLKIDSNKEVYQKESGEWGMGEMGNTLTGELFNVEVIGNIHENPELLEVAE